ncbi:MAG: hypothetical protein HOV94_02960 [Saccharothrix sp.]|nr:hypothetical protein [Saccharothrix sp.]
MTPQEIAELALAGPGEVIAIVDDTSTAHLRWAGNAVTGNGVVHSRTLTVIALDPGGGIAIVSREGALGGHAVRAAVDEARTTARRATPAPDAHPLLTGPFPDPGLSTEPPAGTSTRALHEADRQWADPPADTSARTWRASGRQWPEPPASTSSRTWRAADQQYPEPLAGTSSRTRRAAGGQWPEPPAGRSAQASGTAERQWAEEPADPSAWAMHMAERQWAEPPVGTSARALGGVVAQLAEVFGRARARGWSASGYAEHQVRTTYLATTSGLRLRHAQPGGVLDLTGHNADRSASAWVGADLADPSGTDLLAGYADLAARLDAARHRVDLDPGRYDVILAPSCVADLMTHLHLAADLDDALQGGTVFSAPGGGTRLGERLTEAPLTLASDPAAPGLGCPPFSVVRVPGPGASCFDNGTPLRRTEWISDGALSALVTTGHSARTAGLPCTPRIGNLVLSGPSTANALDDLVAATDHALLVTSLWYLREVDPSRLLLTGVTRDGVQVVKGGEVVGTAHDFRFDESPLELLARVAEVGRTEPALPREWGDREFRTAMPALRVEDFTLTSVGKPG